MEFVNLKRAQEEMDESYGSNESKRKRVSEKFRLRLLVPSKQAGAIIGKGGNRIKELRSSNDANVRIADCPGPERIMVIQSDESATTIKVVEQALTYMSEECSEPLEIRLVLHDSLIGAVLGKKGSRINEMRSETACNIKVYKTCCPQSTERVVAIQGSEEKILVALEMLLEAIKGNSIRGQDILYDPLNFDATFADEYGGFGSKSDLKSLPVAPKFIQSTPMSRSGGSFRKDPIGCFNDLNSSNKMNPMSPWNLNNQGNVGIGNVGNGSMGFNWHMMKEREMMGNNPMNNHATPFQNIDTAGETSIPTETKVTIPDSVVGCIIGHGGSRIRDIRITSKAQINIGEPDDSGERIITIRGDVKTTQIAQYLLQQAVKQNAKRG